jgi:tRNA(Ile)-lysidine synthase
MPQLAEKFGADLPLRLSDQAAVLRDEERFLEGLAREQFTKISDGENLKRAAFINVDKALQRYILRFWIKRRRGHLRSVDFQHIEAALSLIAGGPSQSRIALPGGWDLAREYDTLKLERRSRHVKRQCYSYHFKPGETLNVIEAGIKIQSELIHEVPPKLPQDLMEAIFDTDFLTGKLLVRNFRHGDRFQPIGMKGHKKIKDLFIENKLPLISRAVLPMLVIGDEILWIPGQGRSEIAKIGSRTRVALRLRAVRSN